MYTCPITCWSGSVQTPVVFLLLRPNFTQIIRLTEDAEGEKKESLRPTITKTQEAHRQQRACPCHWISTRIKGVPELISVVKMKWKPYGASSSILQLRKHRRAWQMICCLIYYAASRDCLQGCFVPACCVPSSSSARTSHSRAVSQLITVALVQIHQHSAGDGINHHRQSLY